MQRLFLQMSFPGILSLSHPRASIARPGDLRIFGSSPAMTEERKSAREWQRKEKTSTEMATKRKKAKTLETELAEISAIKYPRQAAFEFFLRLAASACRHQTIPPSTKTRNRTLNPITVPKLIKTPSTGLRAKKHKRPATTCHKAYGGRGATYSVK